MNRLVRTLLVMFILVNLAGAAMGNLVWPTATGEPENDWHKKPVESDNTIIEQIESELETESEIEVDPVSEATNPLSTPPEEFQTTHKKSRYEVHVGDLSWTSAKKMAENLGGYLAVITSQEEFDEVATILNEEAPSVVYVWLGAQSDDGGEFHWLTNEEFSQFNKWYQGEPSGKDTDGTAENCLCMWKIKGVWSWNDQRDDLLTGNASNVNGKIGYVIEFEED